MKDRRDGLVAADEEDVENLVDADTCRRRSEARYEDDVVLYLHSLPDFLPDLLVYLSVYVIDHLVGVLLHPLEDLLAVLYVLEEDHGVLLGVGYEFGDDVEPSLRLVHEPVLQLEHVLSLSQFDHFLLGVLECFFLGVGRIVQSDLCYLAVGYVSLLLKFLRLDVHQDGSEVGHQRETVGILGGRNRAGESYPVRELAHLHNLYLRRTAGEVNLVRDDHIELVEESLTFLAERLVCTDIDVGVGLGLASGEYLLYLYVELAVVIFREVFCRLKHQVDFRNDHHNLVHFLVVEKPGEHHEGDHCLTGGGRQLQHTSPVLEALVCGVYLVVSRSLLVTLEEIVTPLLELVVVYVIVEQTVQTVYLAFESEFLAHVEQITVRGDRKIFSGHEVYLAVPCAGLVFRGKPRLLHGLVIRHADLVVLRLGTLIYDKIFL